jgi:putative restriction endonuclease
MTDFDDRYVVSRLQSLAGNADEALLALYALGRLATRGDREMRWSEAEVALSDLIARFAPADLGASEEISAARAFTRLSAENFWTLDTDLPADRVRVLNERHVTARLDPALEQVLAASPALLRQAARTLVAETFAATEADEVLAAVGLLEPEIPMPPVTPVPAEARPLRRGYSLDAYLRLTVADAREQFRQLLDRAPAPNGVRQVDFVPVETLLCLAASIKVNHRRYGGSTAHTAGTPVPELSRLFIRRPSSVLAKMANLDGSRSHGAAFDARAGATLRENPTLFTHVYRVLLYASRQEGIAPDRLPDFLDLEEGGELDLLGQEELATIDVGDLRPESDEPPPDPETERIRVAAARVGQHLFAQNVLDNCGGTCVFCGFQPGSFGAKRMLFAGHIKPWRDSTPTERLDTRNGIAACPSHDVAFDTGLLTIEDDLRIRLAEALAGAVRDDALARHFYGRPPLLNVVRLPGAAQPPLPKYLAWHRQYVFTDRRR